MQPHLGEDVSNHNYGRPDSPSTRSSTSLLSPQLEHFHPTNCGCMSLFAHQDYTKEIAIGDGLEPVYCTQYAGNMSQYNPAIHLLEQHVGGTQQGIPTLIYNHHPPVDPQLSSYQGQVEYPLGPFNLDTATAAPPQPTRGHPPVYYLQGGQSQGLPVIAEIPASHSPASSRASGSPSSPVLPVSQVLGLTPHRQADSGPRRILALPIDSLSITDPTIHEIVAGFLTASWRLNQIEEPAYIGKSCYFQLIDESTMVCRLCGKQERRAERLVSHLRGHFDHRPYSCGGQCGNKECGQRFTERRGVKDHAERPTVQCPKCIPVKSFSKQNLPRHLRDQHQT